MRVELRHAREEIRELGEQSDLLRSMHATQTKALLWVTTAIRLGVEFADNQQREMETPTDGQAEDAGIQV